MHSANRDTLTHVRTHGPHLAEIYGDHRLAEGQHTPRLWPNQVIQTTASHPRTFCGAKLNTAEAAASFSCSRTMCASILSIGSSVFAAA